MDKRELEIAVVSTKDLSDQTVAFSDAKVYGIISLVNGSEFLQWKTSEAEDVMNPKWNQEIKMVLDEGAIQHDSAHLLISVRIKKERAMQDEQVGCLWLPLRSFLPHVGTLVVRDYFLQSIQGPLTLELGVKLSDKFIPDVSMTATQPTVMSMPANYAVTPPAPLMSPYDFHSPRRANYAITPLAPLTSPYYFQSPPRANSVITPPPPLTSSYYFPPPPLTSPYYFYSGPPSTPLYPQHPYPPTGRFYQGLSSLQQLLQGAATVNSFTNFMSTLGDGEDWGAGSM